MASRPEPAPGDPRSSAELLQAASRGETPALDALIAQVLPQVRAFVRMRVGPEIRAREADSDIVQSVCREVVEDWSKLEYRGEEAFRAWLFTAALNKIREKGRFWRRERRAAAQEAEATESQYAVLASPSQAAMHREAEERLERAMDQLPDEYRTVVALCRTAKLPHAVVAGQMGRSVGAVRQLLGRALLRLSEILRESEPPSTGGARGAGSAS